MQFLQNFSKMRLIHLITLITLSSCIGANRNVQMGTCSMSCDGNEDPVDVALRSLMTGPPGKRGAPGLKGDRGVPGVNGKCPKYGEITAELENVKNSMEFLLRTDGWYRAENHFLYKLFKTSSNYTEARKHCERLGARLAAAGMRDEAIKSEIYHALEIGYDTAWIGLNDLEQQSNWMWEDGVPSTIENTDWGAGQPDFHEGRERCGQYWRGNYFNDADCTIKINHVCEGEV